MTTCNSHEEYNLDKRIRRDANNSIELTFSQLNPTIRGRSVKPSPYNCSARAVETFIKKYVAAYLWLYGDNGEQLLGELLGVRNVSLLSN